MWSRFWRKVFNVYAKLLYALDIELFGFAIHAPSWQQYRDGFITKSVKNRFIV